MASREEEKKKRREEREAREREEQQKKRKRARRLRMAVAAGVILVAAIVAFAVLSGGSDKKKPPTEAGLDVSPGPWGTNVGGLEKRVAALGLPDPSDTVFHIHAQLNVYTDGKKQKIPQNIGIDPEAQYLASLHTHDDTGVVHMEAVRPYKFTLGQFFKVWGVAFSPTQIGGYHANPKQKLVLEVYANGKKVPDPVNYAMKSHDRIVVGFGEPGSFPKTSKFKFPPGE